MKRFALATALSLALVSPSFAAIEMDESQPYGPTYGSTVADLTIGKPLQVVGAVLGTALHVVTYPFAVASDSVEQSRATLVEGPWNALKRCNGCSPSYDNHIKADQESVRFVVDGPSEIVISSNGQVVVNR